MRIDVIDDARRADQIVTLALHAKRVLVQESGTFGAPTLRAVERTSFWIASPCIVLVALTLLAPSNRTVDWWTNGHDAGLIEGNDGVRNDNARDGSSPLQARYSPEHIENLP